MSSRNRIPFLVTAIGGGLLLVAVGCTVFGSSGENEVANVTSSSGGKASSSSSASGGVLDATSVEPDLQDSGEIGGEEEDAGSSSSSSSGSVSEDAGPQRTGRCAFLSKPTDFCENFDDGVTLTDIFGLAPPNNLPQRTTNQFFSNPGALQFVLNQAGGYQQSFVIRQRPHANASFHLELRMRLDTGDNTGETTVAGIAFRNPTGLQGYYVSLIRRPLENGVWQLEEYREGDTRQVNPLNQQISNNTFHLVELDIRINGSPRAEIKVDGVLRAARNLNMPPYSGDLDAQLGFSFAKEIAQRHSMYFDDIYISSE